MCAELVYVWFIWIFCSIYILLTYSLRLKPARSEACRWIFNVRLCEELNVVLPRMRDFITKKPSLETLPIKMWYKYDFFYFIEFFFYQHHFCFQFILIFCMRFQLYITRNQNTKCTPVTYIIQSKLHSGVHPFANYCVIMKNYLQNFTIHPFVKTFYSQICPK